MDGVRACTRASVCVCVCVCARAYALFPLLDYTAKTHPVHFRCLSVTKKSAS